MEVMSSSLYTHNTKHLELLVTQLRRTAQKRGREELHLAQGQGRRPRAPGCDGTRAAERRYPTSEVRGGGREELPHIQGVAAAWAQERREGLLHIQGQEGQP